MGGMVDRVGARRRSTPSSGTVTAVFLACSILVCLPFLDTVFWVGDEGLYLSAAQRLADGKQLYRDMFQVVPPLGFIATEYWLRLFGETIVSARVLVIAVEVAIAFCIFRASRLVYANDVACAVLAFLWLFMSQGYLTQIAHHWFTTLLTMIALIASLSDEGRARNAIIAGLAAGAAAMVTSTRGILCALAAFACVMRRFGLWRAGAFVAAAAILPLAMLAYIVVNGIAADAWFDLVTFNATRYSGVQRVVFGNAATYQNAALILAFPLAAAGAMLVTWRGGWARLSDYRFLVCAVYAAIGFIGCFPRCDIYHIIVNAPLAIPLIAYTVGASPRGRVLNGVLIAAVVVAALASARGYRRVIRVVLETPVTATPAGGVRFVEDAGEPGLIEQVRHMPADARITFYPYIPLMPFLAGRQQLTVVDEFLPEYTTADQYRDACRLTLARADWVVTEKSWQEGGFLRKLFPGLRDADPVEKRRFERGIERTFAPVARSGAYAVLKRRAAPPVAGTDPC